MLVEVVAMGTRIHWTPTKVSYLSLVIMGLVVAAIGLSGARYTIKLLYSEIDKHGYRHAEEVANRLVPLLSPRIAPEGSPESRLFQRVVTLYGSFGYRIVLIDNQSNLVADSHRPIDHRVPLADTWLASLLDQAKKNRSPHLRAGPARAYSEDSHPMLIWLQEIEPEKLAGQRFLLGVASDQQRFSTFMDNLHFNLDVVLLISYVAIGVIGFFSLRAIGRIYERRLEATLGKRTRELEQIHKKMLEHTRLATIGQTASVLAHEMRNPLASIKLALSGLGAYVELPERAQRRIALVSGEVDRLDDLLSQTLDYARPIKFSPHPVAMDSIIGRVIEQQKPLLEHTGVRVEWQKCTKCLLKRVDENLLYQALLNVLKNAIEASPKGGVVRIDVAEPSDAVVLTVTNQGESPDEEVLSHAFKPFFTTKSRGSGLGLGLVKRIVEEHGGTVDLRSIKAGGVCLMITLPGGD